MNSNNSNNALKNPLFFTYLLNDPTDKRKRYIMEVILNAFLDSPVEDIEVLTVPGILDSLGFDYSTTTLLVTTKKEKVVVEVIFANDTLENHDRISKHGFILQHKQNTFIFDCPELPYRVQQIVFLNDPKNGFRLEF